MSPAELRAFLGEECESVVEMDDAFGERWSASVSRAEESGVDFAVECGLQDVQPERKQRAWDEASGKRKARVCLANILGIYSW